MSKTIQTTRDWSSYWLHRTSKEDLLTQVDRTVGGQPLSTCQIEMVVDAIARGLALNESDIVLDLCCGNGLITKQLSLLCRKIVGVDYSVGLIRVARERHGAPNTIYLHKAVEKLSPKDLAFGPPTKICLNSGLQYFTRAMLTELLNTLKQFGANFTIYFSDVPDANKLYAFYNTPKRQADLETRRAAGNEAIGTWWDRNDLAHLMKEAGYAVTFVEQASCRCTAHYRYDVVARMSVPASEISLCPE